MHLQFEWLQMADLCWQDLTRQQQRKITMILPQDGSATHVCTAHSHKRGVDPRGEAVVTILVRKNIVLYHLILQDAG